MSTAGRKLGLQVNATALERRAVVLQRLAHDIVEIDQLALELDLVLGDACDIEQIVHHPHQVLHLAVDDLQGSPGGIARRRVPDDVKAGPDSRKRIA